MESADVQPLIDFLDRHRRVTILTGAGVSTESGIADYRDAAGAWKRPQPVTWQAFRGDARVRARYWARSLVGWPHFAAARPNPAHAALAALEAAGRLVTVLTQNVDGLHQAAGSRRVIDLHGRLHHVRCLNCGERSDRHELQIRLLADNPWFRARVSAFAPDGDADLADTELTDFSVPACRRCGGTLKPDVVFFGENVPVARTAAALAALDAADGLLVAGSSLMVWSGLRLVRAAAERGLPIAAVNLGRTRGDDLFELKLSAACGGTLLTAVAAILGSGCCDGVSYSQ